MRICLLATISLSLALSTASASTILVGANNDGNGGGILGNEADCAGCQDNDPAPHTQFANLGWTQGFHLDTAVIADQLTVFVNGDLTNPANFSAYLSSSIGSSYTAADLLFSGTGAFPVAGPGHEAVSFNLGGLAIGPGTYYVTLLSSDPVTHLASAQDAADRNCIEGELCGGVGGWGSGGSLIVTGFGTLTDGGIAFGTFDNGTAPSLDNASFDSRGSNDHFDFQISGSAATPEPSTIVLVGAGLLGLGGMVRRRVRA